jgi:hypothetical protein
MAEPQAQNNGALINVKRVRKDTDTKGRDKVVLTFGLDKNGNNGADSLLTALAALQGKQVNFDIRMEEKVTEAGATFTSAFVLVKEMIPKEQGTTSYVPKTPQRAASTKATAAKIKAQLDE